MKSETQKIEEHLNGFIERRKEYLEWKDRIDNLSNQLEEILPIIKGNLIPTYNKEQQRNIAIQWFKERARSWEFWLKFIASIGLFFMGMIFVIGNFLKEK